MKYASWILVSAAISLVAGVIACSDDQPAERPPPEATGGASSNPSTGGSTGTSVEEAGFDPTADVEVRGHIFEPEHLEPLDPSQLDVPDGFIVTQVAKDLGNARMIVVAEDGTVYITRRTQGDVLMLKDEGDGNFGAPVQVAQRPGLHGLALHDGKAYLATAHEVFRGDVLDDGSFGPLEMIIHDLPAAGQHNTRTLAVGPDEMLYISIGSTCNECDESNPENATILRGSLDGKQRSIWASGLRDTIGWGWHPETGELWGMDHGIDWLGDGIPPEELNRIERGNRYGWPYFWGDNGVNPRLDPPPPLTKQELAETAVPMVLGYTSHAAPMQLSFYDGPQFPEEYRGDAFVSMHGSWNRKPPAGYEVVRIRFENGQPRSIEPFVTGFVTAEGEHGRPCGNAVAADGSLLFTDDRNGVLYRVAFDGEGNGRPKSVIPAGPMLEQAARGHDVPLAMDRPETAADEDLEVSSPAFSDDETIPVEYSAYEQNVSFPLAWSAGPDGTRSYVLIMEDPDAAMPKPFVHWVAWNIPADVTELPEGLQKLEVLSDPEGLRQGVTSRGTIGYLGPRPPAGDEPHAYHVQVFALDRVLDLPLSGADRDQVLAAVSGHVLARGELVGTFARPEGQVSRP